MAKLNILATHLLRLLFVFVRPANEARKPTAHSHIAEKGFGVIIRMKDTQTAIRNPKDDSEKV